MAEVLHGDGGGNQLNARADKSQVYGLKGNDTLTSDGKSDVLLIGGSGDDSLIMSGGNGTLAGGGGSDVFALTYSATKPLSAVIEDFVPGEDTIVVNFDGDAAPQLSSSATNDGNVILRDNAGNLNVTFKGVRDNDYFDGTTSNEAWDVLALTNDEREAQGLLPLTMSDGLTAGASIRVEEITSLGQDGVLNNHTRPDDKGEYYTVLDGKYNFPGENLDGGARFPEQVMDDWIGSASHYANIVNPAFQKLGVGYNENDADPSNLRFYWVQLFADSLNAYQTVNVSNATPQINAVSKFIQGDDEPNTISNGEYGVTIAALGGSDSVSNSGLLASISGGDDNDTITNSGSFTTINAGKGDDSISLGASTKENVIEYTTGDGNDVIIGLGNEGTLSILDDEFTPAIVGDDIIVAVGNDSITLANALGSAGDIRVNGTRSNVFLLTEGDDDYENYDGNATILALGGDDTVNNIEADNVTILGGAGDDYIVNGVYFMGLKLFEEGNSLFIDGGTGDDFMGNDGSNVTMTGGAGDDYIDNGGDSVTILGDTGNNKITNAGDNVSIETGDGNDSIQSYGSNVTISAGTGDDSIFSNGSNVTVNADDGDDYITNGNPDNLNSSNVTIDAGNGNDTINTWGSALSIKGGDGNESIRNWEGDSLTIDGGAGNDIIDNYGNTVTIDGGAGNDTITSSGESGTINGGSGNDWISNYSSGTTVFGGAGNDYIYNYSDNVLFIYTAGDGNDVVARFNATSTLQIGDGSDTYSTVISEDGNDVVVKVGRGYVTLRGAASLPSVNISGTEREYVEKDNTITLTEGDDTYSSTIEGASIQALGGNDSIDNAGDNVSINGGLGDDTISFADAAQNNVVEYAPGDGNDIVIGFKENDTLSIANDRYTRSTLGNAVVISVGTGSVTLKDAATLPVVNVKTKWNDPVEGNNLITLTEDNDDYSNGVGDATILALGGEDTINNDAANVIISGNNGDDSITNFYRGVCSSINGGAGNDSIRNFPDADFATLVGGDGNDSIVNDGANVSIDAGAGNDYIENWESEATIAGGDGDDTIDNYFGNSAMIDAGAGNDSIRNRATENISMLGGDGDDTILNNGLNVTVEGGAGNDSISNDTNSKNVTMLGGDGDDTVDNWGMNTTMLGGDGKDVVSNYATDVTIDGEAGDDHIFNRGDSVSVSGGEGNDNINNNGANVSITSGDGDDTIANSGARVSILGSDGSDTVSNSGVNATINAGAGNDQIILSGDGAGSFIQYTPGDGDDTIWGLTENSSLQIGDGTGTYSTVGTPSGDDIIIHVGNGSIRLVKFRANPDHIIIGESGTSGGGSGSGGGGASGGGSSSGAGTGSGASGGGSASGSSGGTNAGGSGSSSSSGTNAGRGSSSGGTSSGSSSNVSSGGNSFRYTRNEHSTTANATTATTNTIPEAVAQLNHQTTANATQTTSTTSTQRIYTGGKQVISDYTSGERIVFGAQYTGAFFDGNGNFFAGSTTGALVVQNATDKVVDLGDAAGNSFVKAYAATTAGVIDGRGLAGFELINGSAGADAIYAGDGGSQLWGGADTVSDAMMGGGGTDIFIGGRTQGADFFLNASSADIVHLNDSALSDIVATAEENGTIGIAFNTGNVVAIQSSEALSATVMLADGSAYRFNHANKSWQNA